MTTDSADEHKTALEPNSKATPALSTTRAKLQNKWGVKPNPKVYPQQGSGSVGKWKEAFDMGSSIDSVHSETNSNRSERASFQRSNSVLSRLSKGGNFGGGRTYLDDSQQREVYDRLLVVHPNSRFSFAWTFLLILALVYVAISVPLVMCFRINVPSSWQRVDRAMDVFFMLDFVLNFFTGYTEADGGVVLELKRTSYAYLKSYWFPLDLVTSIPFDWISASLSGVASIRMVKILKGLKALKMVRLSRTMRGTSMEVIEDLLMTSAHIRFAIKMFKLAVSMGFVLHWCCCLWHLVVDPVDESWVRSYMEWDEDSSTDAIPAQYRYLNSMYFVITTMATVGYGDIVAKTMSERKAALLCMVVGGACYGLLIGNMVSIVGQADASTRLYHTRMESILAYMAQRRFPISLQKKIKSYYKRLFETSVQKEHTVLQELSVSLQNEVALFILDGLVFQNQVFKACSKRTLAVVVDMIKPRVHGAEEEIVNEGSMMRNMHIISSGHCTVRSAMKPDKTEQLSRGDSFGEECLGRDTVRYWNCTIVSMDVTDCMEISSDELYQGLMRAYPDEDTELEAALGTLVSGAASTKTVQLRWKVRARKTGSKRKVTLHSMVKKQIALNSLRSKKSLEEIAKVAETTRLENAVLRCAKRLHARHQDDAKRAETTLETLNEELVQLKGQLDKQSRRLEHAIGTITQLAQHLAPGVSLPGAASRTPHTPRSVEHEGGSTPHTPRSFSLEHEGGSFETPMSSRAGSVMPTPVSALVETARTPRSPGSTPAWVGQEEPSQAAPDPAAETSTVPEPLDTVDDNLPIESLPSQGQLRGDLRRQELRPLGDVASRISIHNL